MLAQASMETNEIDIAGTAVEWERIANLLSNECGEFSFGVEGETMQWGCCLTILRIQHSSDGPATIIPRREGVLEVIGSVESLKVLGENAKEMSLADVNSHVHVDGLILPDAISETSASMVWTRLSSIP